MEQQNRQRVKLVHPNGTEFVVFLTEYEINRAESEPTFMQEIMEKYYALHKKNLIRGRNESIDSAAINYEIDTDFENYSYDEAPVENLPEKLPLPGKIWTETNIRILFELCKKFEHEFETSIKKLVWKKVAKILSERSSTTITWSQCDTKFKGLKDYYKTIKKHNDTSGNNFKYWIYYDLMDELLGKKPEIKANFTCSSAKGLQDVNKISVTGTEILSTNDDSDVEKKTSKGNVSSAFEMLHTKKRKRDANVAEKRHQEKLIRQDRYLNLFERLVVSLETKVD